MEWMRLLFDTSDFPARWHCGQWTPLHGWTHVIADLATWAAYFAIPVLLVYFIRRKPDAPFPKLYWCFGAFILACGTVHLIEASIFWWPWYRLSALFKVITAIVSWTTVLLMIPVMPRALELPGMSEIVGKLEREVGERRQYEQRLREYADELEQRNEQLDEFTYIASHDLQEPLRKLVSFSELLSQDIGTDLSNQAAKDLQFITDAASRMRNLIQDLLVLSRSGRSEVKRESLNLGDCADVALRALDGQIRDRDAEVTVDPLPTVLGDRTLLTQLFQNLVSNALKFTPKDRKPQVHVTAEHDGEGWIIGVKDNGIGIAPEYQKQIFGAFKRLHGHDEYEGCGIGLAICERAVKRHGGSIWVESAGTGSHFKFKFSRAGDIECKLERPDQPSYSL